MLDNKGMDSKVFFKHYPQRKEDSNKYDNGVLALIAGSYGMAGAAAFNLIGARSVGASYIHCFLPASIYPIVAANELSAVYHPYDENNDSVFEETELKKIKAIGIGSGIDNLPHKEKYLKDVLKNNMVPIIVDAGALSILAGNEEFYALNNNMILTPHLGEFSKLVHRSSKDILSNKEEIAVNFVLKHHVILVLKGHETLIINEEGKISYNHSGNSALARAGSGDVLTGMISGLCSLYEDPYTAVKDAVWLHGHLADEALASHSKEIFDLRLYPELADRFFLKRQIV